MLDFLHMRRPGLGWFGLKLGFGFFTSFCDKKVTGLLADHGDRGAFVGISDDSFKAGRFGVVEGKVFVNIPEDFFDALVRRAAEALD
jgi:hypothetical protein